MNEVHNQATKKSIKAARTKRAVVCAFGIAMITVGMIALVSFEQMTYKTGMAFLAMFAAATGAQIK